MGKNKNYTLYPNDERGNPYDRGGRAEFTKPDKYIQGKAKRDKKAAALAARKLAVKNAREAKEVFGAATTDAQKHRPSSLPSPKVVKRLKKKTPTLGSPPRKYADEKKRASISKLYRYE